MITAVTLAQGAVHMARRKAIVKHLAALQNFGSMDILCSDKTGTLTSGAMILHQYLDPEGLLAQRVLLLAYLNSFHETGIKSPLDAANLAHDHPDIGPIGSSMRSLSTSSGAGFLSSSPGMASPCRSARVRPKGFCPSAPLTKPVGSAFPSTRSLRLLYSGILEGRKAFGNVMKYRLMGTSSNFGNMLSMAAASLFLPLLPMLPTQLLLNNLLYDLAQVIIPTDKVAPTFIHKPRRWDIIKDQP